MADSAVVITAGTGTNIDTRTEGTNGNHRQVVVLGDPATNAGVAPVDATAGLKVDLGADNDITGTVTANLSATDNAVLDAIAADTTTIAGDTTSIDSKIPALGQALAAASVPVVLTAAQITTLTPPAAITGFATETKQDTIIGHVDGIEGLLTTIDSDTGTIATEVAGLLTDTELRATPVPVSGTVTAELSAVDNAVLDTIAAKDFATQTTLSAMNAKMVSGTDIGDVTINNASGASAVNIQDGGNTITVDGTVAVTNSDITSIKTAVEIIDNAVSGNEMQVDVVGALPAGTNAIGKLAANSGVDIGDVDVTSLTGSTVAHDAADSGSPHKIGYKAYSPDGTTPGTAVAEGDRTDAKSDLDGRQFINDEHPRYWSYHLDTSTAQTDTSVQAAPGAGFQIVITNIIVSTGAATAMNFFLEEGASKIFGPIYLEAVAGRGFCTPAGFKKHITANTAVTITTSASIAQSIDIQGYIQAV